MLLNGALRQLGRGLDERLPLLDRVVAVQEVSISGRRDPDPISYTLAGLISHALIQGGRLPR